MDQLCEKPSTHILDLNDNCLLYVFEKLDVVGLCSLQETCNRLSALSVLAYRLKYGDSFVNPYGRTRSSKTKLAFKQIVIQTQIMVIKTFGANLKKISVTNFHDGQNMTFDYIVFLFKKYFHLLEELQLFS